MPDTIIFVCPCCNIELSVPSSMAGVTGPCPKCRTQITAPRPYQPLPQQHVQPSAINPAQPLAGHAARPAAANGEPIRPEPRQSPSARNQQAPGPAPAQEYASAPMPVEAPPRNATSTANVSMPRRKTPKSAILLRVLIPMAILTILGTAIFFVYQFLTTNHLSQPPQVAQKPPAQHNLTSNTATVPKEDPTPSAKSPSIEGTLDPSETPILTKDNTAIKVTAPEKPVIEIDNLITPISPAIDQTADSGVAVAKLVEDFIAATSLDQRLPMAYTRKSPQELQNTIMNQAWPTARISPGSQIPHAAEQLVEYYFEASFDNNSKGFPKEATILVHKRANEAPKILIDPLQDTIGGRLAAFAKNPTDLPQDFYVIMDARVKCFDNTIPNAHKKSTFFLRAHNTGEDIATAYANEQSNTRKAFDNPLEGLKWKNPMPAIVTLQWNTTEDIKRPFLELLVIKAKNWNP